MCTNGNIYNRGKLILFPKQKLNIIESINILYDEVDDSVIKDVYSPEYGVIYL